LKEEVGRPWLLWRFRDDPVSIGIVTALEDWIVRAVLVGNLPKLVERQSGKVKVLVPITANV
jgi:hypothetical protein